MRDPLPLFPPVSNLREARDSTTAFFLSIGNELIAKCLYLIIVTSGLRVAQN